MNRLCVLLLIAVPPSVVAFAAQPDEKALRPLLQVVRLKPGESKRVELALPYGGVEFRPREKSGRDFLYLETIPKAEGGAQTAKGKSIEHDEKFVFELAPGVRLAWIRDRPEIELRAEPNAAEGTSDVKLRYESFGGGTYVSGFRVIVEAK
jgi:hypothetical protein